MADSAFALWLMARSLRSLYGVWQELSCHRVSAANEPYAIERVKRAGHLPDDYAMSYLPIEDRLPVVKVESGQPS